MLRFQYSENVTIIRCYSCKVNHIEITAASPERAEEANMFNLCDRYL